MHIEFLVEEESAEVTLCQILPQMLKSEVTFQIHVFQGKPDLLQKLPGRLRGYKAWLPDDWKIVVLMDEDREDCKKLKETLEKTAHDAGLSTASASKPGTRFQVLNRLAIEELEAWFFGDILAIHCAYPRFPSSLGEKAKYRNPDAIRGGTWEALEQELQNVGYFKAGLPKIEAAREISRYMKPESNRSKSFQVFRAGLKRTCAQNQE